MYKVGICGHFGGDKSFLDGQTVKTKILTEELKKEYGTDAVQTVDTFGWRSRPITLFIRCFNLLKDCENIIILPAHNGVKLFVPLFLVLNKLFHRKLHYVVIGGWLPKLLATNAKLMKNVGRFNEVYVETRSMLENLIKQGLNNVKYLPNFKRLEILAESELVIPVDKPYKLCTFSRVMKEKGIEGAIKVVKDINESLGEIAYTLDIYGPIDDGYMERFNELKKTLPNYIAYKGVVDFDESVNTLKNYFVLLFPTLFRTEGIPGTIIDAYASGVPVLASSWDSCLDIIDEGDTGFIFEISDFDNMREKLKYIFDNPEKIINMKYNCLNKAANYMPESVIKILVDKLK